MKYTIHLTENWDSERIKRYAQDITKAMNQIANRFPDDTPLEMLATELAKGNRQLWLILDEDENFAAFVTSEVQTLPTGKKRLELLELAGKGGVDLADMIKPIEDWAKTTGISEICPIGRIGWSKKMRQHGYLPFAVKYRKELHNGRQ